MTGATAYAGELFALCAAFSFGLANVAIAKDAPAGNGEGGVFLSAILTALLAAVAGGLSGQSILAIDTGQALWAAIGWFTVSGLLSTVGGRVTLFRSVELAGVIRASTTRRLMPVFALILSFLILGETASLTAGLGMLLVAASFVLVLWDNRAALRRHSDESRTQSLIFAGLAFGVLSAALYSISLVVRKFGLAAVPNGFFGAFIGSLVALLYYFAKGMVSDATRRMVRRTLTRPTLWQFLAALSMAVGQITQFAALMFTGAARVAFINSVEIYISAALAVLVFRTEGVPGVPVLIAMSVAFGGVVLIAVGS